MTHMQYMRLSVLCNFATFFFSNDFHLLVYKRKKSYCIICYEKSNIQKAGFTCKCFSLVYKFGYPDYESLRYWFYHKLEHSPGRLALQCYLSQVTVLVGFFL